jgi:hypothetical protein
MTCSVSADLVSSGHTYHIAFLVDSARVATQTLYGDMKATVELRPGTPTTSNVGIVAEEGDGSRTEDDDLRVHVAKCVLKRFCHG